jgi:hypothetical protein
MLQAMSGVTFGKSPNGTIFAERERERERERDLQQIITYYLSRARAIKIFFRNLYITAVSFLMICGFFVGIADGIILIGI